MANPVLDAVGVSASDMQASVEFYRLLGFDFPDLSEADQHIEALAAPGRVRLMIDDEKLAESLIGAKPDPGNRSVFALSTTAPVKLTRRQARSKRRAIG